MVAVQKESAKGSPWAVNDPWRDVSFTIGAESSNIINVAAQFKRGNNAKTKNVAEGLTVQAYLSSDAAGMTVHASAPTTVALGTAGGYTALVAGKVFQLTTTAAGLVDINITLSSGAGTWYLVIVGPGGRRFVSSAITFAA